jgi:hypothetical protein
MKNMRNFTALFLLSAVTAVCFAAQPAAVTAAKESPVKEKLLYYQVNTRILDSCGNWTIYLGSFDVTLTKKSPKGDRKIPATLGFSLLQNGAIEGIDTSKPAEKPVRAVMKIENGTVIRTITMDSIDYLYNMGTRVRTKGGDVGNFFIDVEGQELRNDHFVLRQDTVVIDSTGRKILKKNFRELYLVVISFTRDGLSRGTGIAIEGKKPGIK